MEAVVGRRGRGLGHHRPRRRRSCWRASTAGSYELRLPPANFREPFGGINWLGPTLVTPAIIASYIWIWAGFAMVVIAAGLAAIPRETLEASRVDGASEWQVFRRVTVPLLAPVLAVVFVTLVINVLKIFDLVLVIAPGSAQRDANVIALQLWKTAFGIRDFGLGSALAVFLLLLVAAGDGLQHPPVPGGASHERRDDRRRTAAARSPRPSRSSRLVAALTRAPATVLLAVVALLWLVPTIGLLVSSFRTAADNAESGWWTALTAPAQLTLQPYRDLLDDPSMVTAFVNTVLITVPSALLVVAVASLAAYAFAWMRFPGRDVLFLIVVGLLVVPLQVALIPVARLYDLLGLFGTIPAVVLFHVAFGLPFAIFLLRNFFVGLPHELLEAARMDGASEWTVFTRVVLPLGLPAIASLLIFQFLWVWNDLLVALVFAGGDTQPLTVAIREQLRSFSANIDVIAPAAFLQMLVPLARVLRLPALLRAGPAGRFAALTIPCVTIHGCSHRWLSPRAHATTSSAVR